MKLIDKDAAMAEIKKLIYEIYSGRPFDSLSSEQQTALWYIKSIMSSIDTLEVKEIETTKVPKHSYFETIYHCGTEPRWKVGDILATYECYSDREGEYVYGKVIDVKNGENDWIYTMNGDFGEYEDICEKELISQDAYKKNK